MEKRKRFQIERLFSDGRPAINFRPVAVCAAAFGAGVYFAKMLSIAGSLFGAALFLCLAAAAYYLGFRRTALAVAAMLLGMLRMTCFSPEIPSAGEYRLEGIVAETPDDTESQTELILKRVSLDGESVSGKIRLVLRNKDKKTYRYGDIIAAEAEITIPRCAMNEGDMDLNAYYRGQGIVALAYAEDADAKAGALDFYGWCLTLREKLTDAIGELYPQHQGVVAGLLLGEKDGIPEEDMQAFRDTGAAHLLAISGLHISIFATAVSAVLRRFSAKLQFAALGAFLLIYSAVTGFAPSVVRAAVMAMTATLARLLGRRYDAPSALAAAFILLLLIEPYSLFQAGFQLSFSAVAGILLLQPVFSGLMRGLFAPLRDALSVSVSASLGIAPVTMATFHRLPLFGLLANLLAVPLAPLILLPALLSICLYGILPGLARLLALPVRCLIDILLAVIRFVSAIPGGVLHTAAPSVAACMLFALACLFASAFFLRPARIRFCCAGAALLLAVGVYCLPQIIGPDAEITALYQQNSGALIVRKGNVTVLLDPGNGEYTPVTGWLSAKGITAVDAVFVSGAAQARAAAAVAEESGIKYVLLYGDDTAAKDILIQNQLFYQTFKKGEKMTLNDGFSVTLKDCLYLECDGVSLALGGSEADAAIRFGTGEEGSFHNDGTLILKHGRVRQQSGRVLYLPETGQITVLPTQDGCRFVYGQPK